MSAKVIMFGIDGGTLDILHPWAEKGWLPNMLRLLQRGTSAPLRSTYPPITPPAWIAMMTGQNPGKTGLYDFMNKIPGSYFSELASSIQNQAKPIWSVISDAGKRVAVINVPMTYPVSELNGIMVSGMGTPGKEFGYTYPDSFKDDIETIVENYRIDTHWAPYLNEEDGASKLLDELKEMTIQRTHLSTALLDREHWDLFMVVFVGADRLQHGLWHEIEKLNQNVESQPLGREVREYFKVLDDAMGQIMSRLDEDGLFLVTSDHGFGPLKGYVNINQYLSDKGYLSFRKEEPVSLRKHGASLLRTLGVTRSRVKKVLRWFGIAMDIDKLAQGFSEELGAFDWGKTKAFSLSTNGVYVNLKGREKMGTVEPGEEYESVRSKVIADLLELEDPENGKKIIFRAQRREEIYNGSQMEWMPDIVVTELDELYAVPEFDLVKHYPGLISRPETHTGNHKFDGIFVAYGKGILPGRACLAPVSILDMVPTILDYLGIDIPEEVDGRSLRIFLKGSDETGQDKQNRKSEGEMVRAGSARKSLTEAERSKILQGLKGLGYIE
jgi:predicted AlkP superfamily phosphohydrolase/phosphomutase